MLGFQAVTLAEEMFLKAHGIVGIPADKDDCGTLKSNSAQSLAIWVEKVCHEGPRHLKRVCEKAFFYNFSKASADSGSASVNLCTRDITVMKGLCSKPGQSSGRSSSSFVSGRRSQELPDQYICTTQFVSLVEAPHAEFGYSESS
ncbi:hypothetical protein PGT21_000281 [Puccinia graminis f. sp. tritici]|uniref:Uncharacterized protein n=1 Tax=Puccinia graminis f. sp. tritici TaxID=56615 RepID=A0A5B0NGS8_PUCGR|nr:hypothetical protein PGT21_000281 [Puccinia graminis f. sp. tritici]